MRRQLLAARPQVSTSQGNIARLRLGGNDTPFADFVVHGRFKLCNFIPSHALNQSLALRLSSVRLLLLDSTHRSSIGVATRRIVRCGELIKRDVELDGSVCSEQPPGCGL